MVKNYCVIENGTINVYLNKFIVFVRKQLIIFIKNISNPRFSVRINGFHSFSNSFAILEIRLFSKMSTNNIISDLKSIDISLHIISERLYSIGLSLFRVANEKRPKIFHPIVLSMVMFSLLAKEIVSYLLDNPRLSMMLGDVSFNWKLKPMWNLTMADFLVVCLSVQAIHVFYGVTNEYPFWLIVINNVRDETRSNKYLYLIKLVRMAINSWVIVAFENPIVVYLFSTKITETLTYGLFAGFSNGLLCYYGGPIIFWQILCYCLIAYRFKLQLKLENNRLLQLSKRIDRNIGSNVMNCFESIDRIHGSIREFDRFWSKISFIFVMLFGIVFGVCISQLFGNVEQFMVIILLLLALTFAIDFTTIILSASLIYVEAKKTHRILYKLITQKRMARELHLTLKVNFILNYY